MNFGETDESKVSQNVDFSTFQSEEVDSVAGRVVVRLRRRPLDDRAGKEFPATGSGQTSPDFRRRQRDRLQDKK